MSLIATIYKTMDISAAHQLNLPYESKCNRMHGHNFKIEVWITGEVNEDGIVMDFYNVKKIVMKLDHQNLNDFIETPTAENIALVLINRLKALANEKIKLIKVRVWETGSAYAECERRL